mmetsp:Transcript_56498/g.145479  ORF Transcript_56498/g.145479 Transcript_56498/m.145479 type:complete len:461 (-) Transcript_56498:248-1630(-)
MPWAASRPPRRVPLKAAANLVALVVVTPLGVAGDLKRHITHGGGNNADTPSVSRSSEYCTPSGAPCIFPFSYGRDQTLYHECTTVDSDWSDDDSDGDRNDGDAWCGTAVNVTYDPATYGRCGPCPVTTTTPSTSPAGTTTTQPVVWLSLIGGQYYINLPIIDNWSMYGSLNTTWTKLRIVGMPHLGDGSLRVDLHDWTFSSSEDQSASSSLSQVEWGIAGACDGESEMHVNLVGTPFAFEAAMPVAEGADARGSVTCSRDRQTCAARCGGWCGFCGLGEPAVTQYADLEVVDRELYDAALWDMFDAAEEALQTTTLSPHHHRQEHGRSPQHSREEDHGMGIFSWIMSLLVLASCCGGAMRLHAKRKGKPGFDCGGVGSGALSLGSAALSRCADMLGSLRVGSGAAFSRCIDILGNLRRPYAKFSGDAPTVATPAPSMPSSTSMNTLRGPPRLPPNKIMGK